MSNTTITFSQLKQGEHFKHFGNHCVKGLYQVGEVAIMLEDGECKWTVWIVPPSQPVEKVEVQKPIVAGTPAEVLAEAIRKELDEFGAPTQFILPPGTAVETIVPAIILCYGEIWEGYFWPRDFNLLAIEPSIYLREPIPKGI